MALDSLHHTIQNTKVRLNDTIGENAHLRVLIDIERKNIVFAKDSISNLEAQIEQHKKLAKAANAESIACSNEANEMNN